MRNLWRAAAFLFGQYPILWLPVLLADLTGFCLKGLQVWMTHAVLEKLLAGHSVLSNTAEPITTLPATWAAVFGTTKFLVWYLNIYLYAAAMIAVSILLPALIAQKIAPWLEVLSKLKEVRTQMLLFSLKAFGIILITSLLSVQLTVYLSRLPLAMFSTISDWRSQSFVLIALLYPAIAWLLAPTVLTLLCPAQSPPKHIGNLRQSRNFAAVCVLVSEVVYLLSRSIEPSFGPLLTTALAIQAFWAIASAVSAIPYILLFIALYLIVANPDSQLTTPSMMETATNSSPESIA
jgi:hypothetical protein